MKTGLWCAHCYCKKCDSIIVCNHQILLFFKGPTQTCLNNHTKCWRTKNIIELCELLKSKEQLTQLLCQWYWTLTLQHFEFKKVINIFLLKTAPPPHLSLSGHKLGIFNNINLPTHEVQNKNNKTIFTEVTGTVFTIKS